jgi:hypothetical protein
LHSDSVNSRRSTVEIQYLRTITIYYQLKTKIMNIIRRAAAPTPKFFKKVRKIGLILAAISGTLLASPVALPVIVMQIATYLAVAGSVASAVSQVATESGDQKSDNR